MSTAMEHQLVFFLLVVSFGGECVAVERGTIIPLYIYPKTSGGGDAWAPLKKSFAEVPIDVWAIVNVFNGPGATKDANYVSAIRQLHSEGINTLGYVRTNYSRRTTSGVKGDVRRWKNWYGTKGIFFDEMTSTEEKVSTYEELTAFAKDTLGFSFVVGNAGTRVSRGYFSAVDTVVVYESPGLSTSTVEEWVCGYGDEGGAEREGVAVLAYNVSRLGEAAVGRAKECGGFVYVTNDGGDNPWDSLPPFLSALFRKLSE